MGRKVANVVPIVHVLRTFAPGVLTAIAQRFGDGESTPLMFSDRELERPDDGVVSLHFHKQFGEQPVLDLEIKSLMRKMVDSSNVEIHGEGRELCDNGPELADTGLLADMNILKIQAVALEKPIVRFGEATAHQVHVLICIFRELMEA